MYDNVKRHLGQMHQLGHQTRHTLMDILLFPINVNMSWYLVTYLEDVSMVIGLENHLFARDIVTFSLGTLVSHMPTCTFEVTTRIERLQREVLPTPVRST